MRTNSPKQRCPALRFKFEFDKNDRVRVQVHSPVQSSGYPLNPNQERIQKILVRGCSFDFFYLVAYLFSYHEKAINALYELA